MKHYSVGNLKANHINKQCNGMELLNKIKAQMAFSRSKNHASL